MFKQFPKIFIQNNDVSEPSNLTSLLNRLQTNIYNTFFPLVSNTQNDSVILTNISLTSGKDNIINTTLGRNLMGWLVIDNNTNCTIWRTQPTLSPNLLLSLRTSANCTISLEIF